MKSVLKEMNRLAEKKTGVNPKKNDVGDVINFMSEDMTGTDPNEQTVAGALKYYVDNYVSGGNEPKVEVVNPLIRTPFCANITKIGDFTFNGPSCAKFFQDCDLLTDIDFKNIDTSQAKDMSYMFSSCHSLKSVPLFDTSIATSMSYMFQYCTSLEDVPLFDTSSARNMNNMFMNCSSLEDVPLFDTSSAGNMYRMFDGCPNLTDESLDNILQMCINSNMSSNKTLAHIGFTATVYPVSRIEALPHYQDFIDAGWTIGFN